MTLIYLMTSDHNFMNEMKMKWRGNGRGGDQNVSHVVIISINKPDLYLWGSGCVY